MKVRFYNFTKRNNSTKTPSGGVEVDVDLKGGCDNVSPTLLLNSQVLQNTWTYFLIVPYGRYYYIESINAINNNLYEVKGSLDPLATWKGEILSTKGFVLYSASNVDNTLKDLRLSTQDRPTYKISSQQLIKLNDVMAYVLTYVASQPNIGGSGVAVLAQGGLDSIISKINDSGFVDHVESTLKGLMNVYDCVLNCIALPYTPTGENTVNIFFAGYDMDMIGVTPDKYQVYEIDLPIPWQFGDFRNGTPYTSLLLELPFIGTVELNPDDFINQSSIHLKAVMDNITGDVVIYVGQGQMKLTGNCATQIQIGTVKANGQGYIGAIMSGISSMASGNISNFIQSSFNATMASIERSVGSVGGQSSYIGSVPSTGAKGHARLISICHNTNIDPSSVADTIGRPLNQVKTLGELSGFCQCSGFSVNGSMAQSIKEQINDTVNGGIFIE